MPGWGFAALDDFAAPLWIERSSSRGATQRSIELSKVCAIWSSPQTKLAAAFLARHSKYSDITNLLNLVADGRLKNLDSKRIDFSFFTFL